MKYTSGILFLVFSILLLSIQATVAYAEPFTTLTYLKDGKEVNGVTMYQVDYTTMKLNSSLPVQRFEVTENSNVKVGEANVDLDLVIKVPDAKNPTAYSPLPENNGFRITFVEPIAGDQGLNKYKLQDYLNINPIPATMTETSPTTAILNVTIDIEDLNYSYRLPTQSEFSNQDLDQQLDELREKIAVGSK